MPITKDLGQGYRVHGFQTGTVTVSSEHAQYSGGGLLRIPKILAAKNWMDPVPIWAWAIETPHGNFLVDTGETPDYFQPGHFRDPLDHWVHHRILKLDITENQRIDRQLAEVGLAVDQVDAVLMTHLHLDHVDGIRHLKKGTFLVPRTDWNKPIGVPKSVLPEWFEPDLITLNKTQLPFEGAYEVTPDIKLLATPGHTFGHQSVLLSVGNTHILFAGDVCFNEGQFLREEIPGISIQIGKSRDTLRRIKQLASEVDLVFLPSHDPESGERLLKLRATR